jgi:hypothetical protein
MAGKKEILWGVISRLGLAILFLILALWIVLGAAGLQIEVKSRRIIQTGLVSVKSVPKDSALTIDGEQYQGGSPWRITGLVEGYKAIEVSGEDRITWHKRVYLPKGGTASYQNVVLFFETPQISVVEPDRQDSVVSKLSGTSQDERLEIKNGTELWFDGALVTRLTGVISDPTVYPDDQHLAFIGGGFLHIVDIDGSNDYARVPMNNDDAYVFVDGGTSALYRSGGELRIAKIR